MDRVPSLGIVSARGSRLSTAPLLLSLGLLLASGCHPSRTGLAVANPADLETLDPQKAMGSATERVLLALHSGLTRLEPATLRPLPGLAVSWERSPDRRDWVFHLRSGLRYSDGSPLVAEDFLQSWLRVLDPATASRGRNWLLDLRGARTWRPGDPPPPGLSAGSGRLEVHFLHPAPAFLEHCASPLLAPLPPAALGGRQEVGTVSSGPFRLALRRLRDRVRVVRNPWYWNAAAVRLPSIDFLTVESGFTALNLYLHGDVDYLSNVPPLAVRPLRALARSPDPGLAARFAPHRELGTEFYRFNLSWPPFQDVRVRRALCLAIDREALCATLASGERPTSHFLPEWLPGYHPPPGLAHDPEEARALLAAAGYPGGEGFPVLELLYSSSETNRIVAEVLQEQFRRELGLRCRLANQEWKVFLNNQRARRYVLSRSSWIGDDHDPAGFLAIFRGGSPDNRTGWRDSDYDRLLDRARDTADPERRSALLAAAESRLLAAAPILPLFHYSSRELVSPRVRGFQANDLGRVAWEDLSLPAEDPRR